MIWSNFKLNTDFFLAGMSTRIINVEITRFNKLITSFDDVAWNMRGLDVGLKINVSQ